MTAKIYLKTCVSDFLSAFTFTKDFVMLRLMVEASFLFVHFFFLQLPLPADSYRVLVRLQCCSGGSSGSMCLVEPPEDKEEEEAAATGGASSHLVLGRVSVDRCTRWSQLSSALGHTFTSYLRTVSGESLREEAQRSPLGLGPGSISSILIGEDPGCCLDVLFDSTSEAKCLRDFQPRIYTCDSLLDDM